MMRAIASLSALFLCATVLVVGVASEAKAVSVMNFRPGPGANDGTDEGGINGGKDTWSFRVESSVNKGDLPIHHTWNSNCNAWSSRSYLQFDVSSLPTPDDVLSVTLVTQQRIARSYGWNYPIPNPILDVYAVMEAWNEMGLTWNQSPAVGTLASSHEFSLDTNNPMSGGTAEFVFFQDEVRFDIMDIYTAWKSGNLANNGIMIERRQLFCENAIGHFIYSSDNEDESLRPYLQIEYTGVAGVVPEPLTMVSLMMGACGLGTYVRRRTGRQKKNHAPGSVLE